MLARSLAAKGDTASVQAAAETLVSAANHLYDYSIEGEVLGAAYDLQAGNRRRAIARVRSALDLDPDMTEAIFHEPLMQTAELQWKSLLPLCRELNDRLKLPAARMLLAECLVKAGQAVDAQKLISDALAASSADGATTRLYHTMNAYVLHSLGRDEDARSALRLVGQASAPKLATIVLGRLCEASGDDDCAAQAWEKIQDDRPLIPLAETGLARVAFRQSRKEDGERLVAHVLSVAPRYLPAMKFNEERKRP
jgi:tetratricopeptide (TPR) repeat protein